MAFEKRKKKHENGPCPYPMVKIEDGSFWPFPYPKTPDEWTPEQWEASSKLKKVDANDLVHQLGPDGFRKWLDDSPTYALKWDSSRIVSLGTLKHSYPRMRDPVIHKLLRRSETMNIIAAPKSSKSWLALNIAMNVIGGGTLFGKFQCERGRVLIIDNELHPETIAERGRQVGPALNVPDNRADRMIDFLSLRGDLTDINQLVEELQYVRRRAYNVIILDAFYKFYPPDFDENDNAAMARLYTVLDDLAENLDSALILIHHASKGNSSGKSVTDMGAGAGSQSRACDAHLVLREHEHPGIFVFDCANRSFPPIDRFCARFKWPMWELAESYDVEALKGLPKKKDAYGNQKVGDPKRPHLSKKEEERMRLDEMVLEIQSPMTQSDILALGEGRRFFPWNLDRIKYLLPCWIKDNIIKVVDEKRGRLPATYISTKALSPKAVEKKKKSIQLTETAPESTETQATETGEIIQDYPTEYSSEDYNSDMDG